MSFVGRVFMRWPCPKQCPIIKLCHFATVSHKGYLLRFLKKRGITKEKLMKYPAIFTKPEAELKQKIELISSNMDKTEDILSLLLLPHKDFICYLGIKLKSPSKITDLAELMEVSNEESAQLFFKYKFLMRSKISTIKEKVDIILDGGIRKEDLRKDLWILTYPKEVLKKRLKLSKTLNLKPIKPWMLRCKEETIQRSSDGRAEEIAAVAPHSNSVEFLCVRLGLNQKTLDIMTARHPPVIKVQGSKLRELIDFLLAEGFTKEQIFLSPRILCHSLETIKSRLWQLREFNYEPHTLRILCKNKKEFEDFLSKLRISSQQS